MNVNDVKAHPCKLKMFQVQHKNSFTYKHTDAEEKGESSEFLVSPGFSQRLSWTQTHKKAHSYTQPAVASCLTATVWRVGTLDVWVNQIGLHKWPSGQIQARVSLHSKLWKCSNCHYVTLSREKVNRTFTSRTEKAESMCDKLGESI